MRSKTLAIGPLVILGLALMNMALEQPAQARHRGWYTTSATIPAGTSVDVRLDSEISTDDAQPGEYWHGTVIRSVASGSRVVIPAGSPVTGVVTSVAQGTHNSKAYVDLALREVNVNGQSYELNAEAQPVVAGTKRAKKIGAIAGGAVVGGVLGHAVGGKKGTIIGGLLGGAATYGLTRNAFRTLKLKSGTQMTFTIREDVVARRYQ